MTTIRRKIEAPYHPVGIAVVLCLFSWPNGAYAHTVEVCWHAEVDDSVTFYAGTYHVMTGPPQGGMLIDGVGYDFTDTSPELPQGITNCQPEACVRIGGRPPHPPVHWQIVNVPGLSQDPHSFSTTKTSGMEFPWYGCYPQIAEFGSCPGDADFDNICDDIDNCPGVSNVEQSDADADGAGDPCDPCPHHPDDDVDGDGVCENADACPGTTLPENVPTEELGVNRFADLDGDGNFETVSPNDNGAQRSYTVAEMAGCSCEQIIEALDLGQGHTKFGCSIGALETWLGQTHSPMPAPMNEMDQLDGSEHAEAMSCRLGPSAFTPWALGAMLCLMGLGLAPRTPR